MMDATFGKVVPLYVVVQSENHSSALQVIQMNDEHCTVVDDDASVGSVTRMTVDAVAAQGINHQLVGELFRLVAKR